MADAGEINDDQLLADQVAYYRARADEYEFWWERSHQYELDPDAKATWDEEVSLLESWVDDQRPTGEILELACGTGIWTRRLVRWADHLTAVDASPEVLRLNQTRLRPADVRRVSFVEADLFSWLPSARYDLVFFSFWLSHVPPSRVEGFWHLVRDALKPDGRVIFLDNRFSSGSWPHAKPDSYVQERSDISAGARFQIVKRYLDPAEIEGELSSVGWHSRAFATERFFVYGWATAADPVRR